jgi:hypothetical protein
VTLQDLGSVGELIAAVATVITLLYLAVQIRQNTRAVRGSAIQGMTETSQFELHWAHELAAVWTKSIERPAELTSAEAWSLNAWLRAALVARQNEFFQYRMGLLDAEIWAASQGIIRIILSSPWTRNWWDVSGRGGLSPAFVSHIESLPDLEAPFQLDEALLDGWKSGAVRGLKP